jgi:hypothetical protein
MGLSEYFLRGPAKQLAQERGISEEEAMQDLLSRGDEMQGMMATGAGLLAGRGIAPRGLPEPQGASPKGMRGQMVSPKANPAVEFNASKPTNRVYEALETPKVKAPTPKYQDGPGYDPGTTKYPGEAKGYSTNPRYQIERPMPEAAPLNPPDKVMADGVYRNTMRENALNDMISQMNKDVPFFKQPKATQMANFNRNSPMAEIPVEASPVRVNKRFLK